VQWVRNVRICVFKVKYDGREIPCDYTEPVLSRYVPAEMPDDFAKQF